MIGEEAAIETNVCAEKLVTVVVPSRLIAIKKANPSLVSVVRTGIVPAASENMLKANVLPEVETPSGELTAGLVTLATSQENIKTCGAVQVRSIDASYNFVQNIPLDAKQETIETLPSALDPKDITIVARGPVLGSMDSRKIETQVSCTSTGVTLLATISRSEHFSGTNAKNVLWQPKITVIAKLGCSASLQVMWRMRLTNGREIDRGRTPPYREQNYPIIIRKTLRSTSSPKE